MLIDCTLLGFYKRCKETVIALICIAVGNIINRCNPSGSAWTYLKYDDKLYVLCSSEVLNSEQLKRVKITKVGTVKKRYRNIYLWYRGGNNKIQRWISPARRYCYCGWLGKWNADKTSLTNVWKVVIWMKVIFVTLQIFYC